MPKTACGRGVPGRHFVTPNKDEIKHLRDVAKYLMKFNIVPEDWEGKGVLDQIIKDHNWDKK